MLLKRIEMQGFKSFADKTVLDFDDGVTAVVGPNGSGKSNISDAIRWVIGEMSAKTLRGSNMQDVIFAGTETRKALNYAEVTLVLDNSSHVFDINYDELTVTRRLFRSGESIYMINKTNCRLKDIHELFMDTGLGRDGYSIIGQGNVAKILSTKAEDRRSLFEEAAGVAKYKYKKEEAERKLVLTDENLVRINDIASELESQLEPLKNQSEKARKYLGFYEEFKTLDVNISLNLIDKNNQKSDETDEMYENINASVAELRAQENESELKISALYEEQKKKDAEKTKQNEMLLENEAKRRTYENESEIARNNIKNDAALIERNDREIETIEEKNKDSIKSREEWNNKIQMLREEATIEEKDLGELRNKDADFAERMGKITEDSDLLKKELVNELNSISSVKEKIEGTENLRKNFIERREAVNNALASHSKNREEIADEIKRDEKSAAEKKNKLSGLKETAEKQQKRAEEYKLSLADINEKLLKLNIEYNSSVSKKKMLDGMENDYFGYSKSVKAVLKATELRTVSIYGTVSGLIDVERKYAVAVETALGAAMQNIVVGSEEDAKAAIAYLKKNNSGRATFLPLTSVKARTLDNASEVGNHPGFIGMACDIISYDKKYDGIMKNLLGRTAVFDNIDNAVSVSKKFGYRFKVVTPDGDMMNPGGSISGGSANHQSGILSRAAQIKELAKEITLMSEKMRELTAAKESAEKELTSVNNQLSSYIPLIREYEDEILRLENTCAHLKNDISTSETTASAYEKELTQIEEQLAESSDIIAEVLSDKRKAEAKAADLEQKVNDSALAYNELSEQKDANSDLINEKALHLAETGKEIEALRNNIEAENSRALSFDNEIASKKADKERLSEDITVLKTEIAEKVELAGKIKLLSEEYRKKISLIDEQKSEITDRIRKIQGSNKELTDKLLELQQELSKIDSTRVKLNMERENILTRLWDDYELSYNDALAIRSDAANERGAQKRLNELKKAIKDLGNVNMEAIEEYKKVKERYEFLSGQKKDLEKSKSDLIKIIDSMQDLMKEHFGEQFTNISKSFSEVFTELFGGGNGRLYLTDPDNLLESGIEIEVQLPGKSRQNLDLYSGGEKSFIAIALLFSILRVKPTPFCILDEIDAALDDINVSRFATYLKNYIDCTQFIVITHRRGTMEAANILYGVTMQEKGISKLLSLHLDEVSDEMAG